MKKLIKLFRAKNEVFNRFELVNRKKQFRKEFILIIHDQRFDSLPMDYLVSFCLYLLNLPDSMNNRIHLTNIIIGSYTIQKAEQVIPLPNVEDFKTRLQKLISKIHQFQKSIN